MENDNNKEDTLDKELRYKVGRSFFFRCGNMYVIKEFYKNIF